MRRVLVNYADRRFYQAQQRNCASALRVGGFSTCAALRRADLDPAFVERNRRTLSARRGAGYWLWKPYVIAKVLGELEPVVALGRVALRRRTARDQDDRPDRDHR